MSEAKRGRVKILAQENGTRRYLVGEPLDDPIAEVQIADLGYGIVYPPQPCAKILKWGQWGAPPDNADRLLESINALWPSREFADHDEKVARDLTDATPDLELKYWGSEGNGAMRFPVEEKGSPDQPPVPAGSPEGGEFAGGSGGEHASRRDKE